MRLAALLLLLSTVLPSMACAQQVPVFEISKADSVVKFSVSASVPIAGTFDKWDASIAFTSPELSTAVLDVKIQADSVNTGSGMKDGKLKGKDFFDVKDNPLITFHSKKVVQVDPTTVEFERFHNSRRAQTGKADVYSYGQRDWCRYDHGDNGIRPKGIRHE
jgi:polyisoprenoid-binding protein YceI